MKQITVAKARNLAPWERVYPKHTRVIIIQLCICSPAYYLVNMILFFSVNHALSGQKIRARICFEAIIHNLVNLSFLKENLKIVNKWLTWYILSPLNKTSKKAYKLPLEQFFSLPFSFSKTVYDCLTFNNSMILH